MSETIIHSFKKEKKRKEPPSQTRSLSTTPTRSSRMTDAPVQEHRGKGAGNTGEEKKNSQDLDALRDQSAFQDEQQKPEPLDATDLAGEGRRMAAQSRAPQRCGRCRRRWRRAGRCRVSWWLSFGIAYYRGVLQWTVEKGVKKR